MPTPLLRVCHYFNAQEGELWHLPDEDGILQQDEFEFLEEPLGRRGADQAKVEEEEDGAAEDDDV
jgi:hypothetical protein